MPHGVLGIELAARHRLEASPRSLCVASCVALLEDMLSASGVELPLKMGTAVMGICVLAIRVSWLLR